MKDAAKLADAGTGTAWGAWFVAHYTGINETLQLVALLVAIGSGVCAAIYHVRAYRKLGK